jgi:hypothetical protein
MSGSVIGGVVGAVIGYFIPGVGPALGYAIGSAAGGLLFPEQVEGPRLEDLRAQSSEYGRPIPITFGTIALGGNVIWASELIEVANEEGGKGGPEVTSYSYFANFAVAICEGPVQLGRIWAGPDKRLIWDGGTLEGADSGAQMRFYSGSEDQLPDALIESYMGVGMVPAYRGTAYVVFENFPVAKDGNRIPFLTVEVGNVEADLAPEDLGQVWIQDAFFWDVYYVVAIYGHTYGFIVRRQDDDSFVRSLTYTVSGWVGLPSQNVMFLDPDRERIVVALMNTRNVRTFSLANGVRTEYVIENAVGADASPSGFIRGACYHNGYYIFAAGETSLSGDPTRVTLFVVDPDTMETVYTYVGHTADGIFCGPIIAPLDGSNLVYGFTAGSPSGAWELPISSGFTATRLGDAAPNTSFSNRADAAIDPNTGYIWTARQASASQGYIDVTVNDPATNAQIYSAQITTTLRWNGTFTFAAGAPNTAILSGDYATSPPIDQFLQFNADNPALLADIQGSAYFLAAINDLHVNPTTGDLMAFRFGGWVSFGVSSAPASVNFLQAGSPRNEPESDNVYLGNRDASVRQRGEPLSDVVLALSQRAGLDASQVDVTQLEDDMVDGYAIANQMDVKSAIMALAPAYFFDAVESGGVIKYVKRGGAIAAVIDDDELGAYESGSQPVEDLETTRIMDEELPRIVTARYLLEATKYDTATKIAKRLIGHSGSEAAMDLPLVLTDTKAQEIAEVNLHGPWVARLTYRFSLPRKYAYLEPTDIVAVKGHTMRIATIKQTSGRYQIEAVHDDSNVYIPNVVVTETAPPPSTGVETVSATVLELM